MSFVSVSIVIPAYNEEETIESVVDLSFKVLKKTTPNHEVVVVDDASKDQTPEILKKLQEKYKKLRVIRNRKNLGIGKSLKVLYQAAEKEFLFLLPADNQARATELPKFLRKAKDFDLVCGWAEKTGYPFHRKMLTYFYNLFLRVLLKTGVKNADSIKLIKSKILEVIDLESNSGFVDAELITKARKHDFNITELPIKLYPRIAGKASGIKLPVALAKVFDFIILLPKLLFYQPKARC